MTKNKNEGFLKLNMSLLPVVLLLVLIVGAGYFLMKGEFKLPKIFNREPEVRRLSGFPTVVNTTEIIEKQRVIITNQEDLTKFLNTVDKSGMLTLNEKIDFDKEYLLGASTSTQKELGTTLKVKKIYQNKDEKTLIVSVEQTSPGKTCEIDQGTNVAVDVVAISKTDWKINFESMKKVNECKDKKESMQDSTDTTENSVSSGSNE